MEGLKNNLKEQDKRIEDRSEMSELKDWKWVELTARAEAAAGEAVAAEGDVWSSRHGNSENTDQQS